MNQYIHFALTLLIGWVLGFVSSPKIRVQHDPIRLSVRVENANDRDLFRMTLIHLDETALKLPDPSDDLPVLSIEE